MKNKKIRVTKPTKHEIVVRVQSGDPTEKDLHPEVVKSKYMIQKTWMSESQVLKMVQQTPQQHIYTRPGKGGGSWSYVTQSYVVKVLNFVFGWNWDFEVIDKGREGDQVWVLGKLTVKSPKGDQITKTQFGRADVKFKKNSKEMLDYGNDLKSASSDALKKCASLLGVASDIYGKMEFKQEANKDITQPQVINTLKPGQVVGPDKKPVYLCAIGQEIISETEYNYSMKMFKKPLCREHQNQKNGK